MYSILQCCSLGLSMCLTLCGHLTLAATDLIINVQFQAVLGSRGMQQPQQNNHDPAVAWTRSPIALIPVTSNYAIQECWRQFQDLHLFCITIIRASRSWFTLRTAAKTARWKSLRSDGSDREKAWRENSVVLVKWRCVLTLLTPYQVLIHTQSINITTICETQLLSHCSILTSLPLLSSKLLDSPQKRVLKHSTDALHRS